MLVFLLILLRLIRIPDKEDTFWLSIGVRIYELGVNFPTGGNFRLSGGVIHPDYNSKYICNLCVEMRATNFRG